MVVELINIFYGNNKFANFRSYHARSVNDSTFDFERSGSDVLESNLLGIFLDAVWIKYVLVVL